MREHKALKWFAIGIMVLFVAHQIYTTIYNPITTESAKYFEAVDGINASGIVSREETIITSDTAGVLHFVVSDGSRIAKNGVIADIYDSASTSNTVSRISELTERIADIKEMQNSNNTSASDLSLANTRVDNALTNLYLNSRGGNYGDTKDYLAGLLSAINRRQMVTGEQTDFSQKLAELENELATLNASLPNSVGGITAPMSGYFMSHLDGYETVLSGKTPQELTPEFLKTVKSTETPQNAIGKIVSGYEWNVACTVSINDSKRFKVGDYTTLHTSVNGGTDLDATVAAVNTSGGGDEATLVLTCESVSEELASMRTGNFTVVVNSYSGLKVPKKALRIVDGKAGVYVLEGIKIRFVEVKVIYTVDDYIICEQNESNDDASLRLYDDVVVRGKKLYDGKVVG